MVRPGLGRGEQSRVSNPGLPFAGEEMSGVGLRYQYTVTLESSSIVHTAWSSPKWCMSEKKDRIFSDSGRARGDVGGVGSVRAYLRGSLGTARAQRTRHLRASGVFISTS